MKELKSCPFCGHKKIHLCEPHEGQTIYTAECKKCGASTDIFYTRTEAIEAWNTRTEKTCKWVVVDAEYYKTDCGRSFCFNSGGPEDNEYDYCPGCGRRIER